MFSIPVYSGLKPAPNSKRAEILPFISTLPPVGFNTPVIILSIVDLPAPFVPKRPTHSPSLTSKLMFLRA